MLENDEPKNYVWLIDYAPETIKGLPQKYVVVKINITNEKTYVSKHNYSLLEAVEISMNQRDFEMEKTDKYPPLEVVANNQKIMFRYLWSM